MFRRAMLEAPIYYFELFNNTFKLQVGKYIRTTALVIKTYKFRCHINTKFASKMKYKKFKEIE